MIVIKVDSNGNVTTVPAVVHMGESMVEAVIYSDAYHSLCTMRILPPNQEQVEEVICTPIIDDTKKRVSAWKATLPDTITAQSGLCNYQLLFTNLNGKQEVSEQGTFKISGNVPYNAPATVEDFSQYTISELYALLDTLIATYEGLSQQIAMLGGDFSDIEKISQVVHPALLLMPTEISEITLKPQGLSAWWDFMSVNGGEDTVRLTSTQLDPFLYLAKDGFTISGQVLKTSKKFVVKYKTSDTSMTGGSFRFDFTDGSKAFKSVEYINDGEWHLLTFDFYDIVPESASSGVLSGIYWEWASLAVTAGVNIEIAYVGFFDGEIVDLIARMVGDNPSGGGGALPLSGKTVILFGEDFDAYKSYIGDYISQLTGANVINAGISNTTMSTCCLTSELNAFSGYELIHSYARGNYELQETALASDSFPQTLDKARCQAVIDALKASPRDEIAIFVSYGKNDLSAGATLKNESSLYDSSTIYGSFLGAESLYQLLRYLTLTICSPIWSFHYVIDTETFVSTSTALEDYENETTGIKGSEIVAPIKEVAELYRAPFVDLMNYGWSKQSMYSKLGGQASAYGWKHLYESDNYVLNIARIIARELI